MWYVTRATESNTQLNVIFFCLVAFGSASFWDLAAVALLMLWRFIKNTIASLQTWHCYSYFYILVPNKWFCMKNKIPTKQFGQILRLRKGWKGCCDGCHNFQSHLLHFTLIGKDGVSAEWAWSILLLGILFARKIWIGLLKHAGSFWKGLIFLDRRWRETCPILLLDDGYALKSSKQLKSVWNSCAKNSLTWDMPKRRKKRGGNSRRTCKTQFIWVQGRSKSLRSIFPILCVASFSSTKNWRHCAIALSPCWVVISGQVFCWFELGFVLSKLPGHKHCAKERNLSSELQEAKQQDSWVQIEMRTTGSNFFRILLVSVCGFLKIFHSLRGPCYFMVNSWWIVIRFISYIRSIELAGSTCWGGESCLNWGWGNVEGSCREASKCERQEPQTRRRFASGRILSNKEVEAVWLKLV